MESSHKPTVIFLGNTGTGKSAVCNYFSQKLAGPKDKKSPFEESDGPNSTIMINPVAQSYNQMQIVDTPGLQDSGGTQTDIDNLTKISEFTQELQVVNTFTFVLNEQNLRFDESTQATFCLFYTRFGGDKFLQHVNFIFTKANSMLNGKEQTQNKVKQFTETLSKRMKIPIEDFPQFECFQFECHPEKLEGTSDDYKQQLVQRTEDEFQSFLQAVTQTEPLDLTKLFVSPEVMNNAQKDADSQQKAEEHLMKIQEAQKIKEYEYSRFLQKYNQEMDMFVELQKNSMETENMRIEINKELKELVEKKKQVKHEIKSLEGKSAEAKKQLEKQDKELKKWWWVLALPVAVRAGIAARTTATSAALTQAALTKSALTASATALSTTTSAAAVASAVPIFTFGAGVLCFGVSAVSTSLILAGIKQLSKKDEKAFKK